MSNFINCLASSRGFFCKGREDFLICIHSPSLQSLWRVRSSLIIVKSVIYKLKIKNVINNYYLVITSTNKNRLYCWVLWLWSNLNINHILSVRNVLREHARSMPLRATCSEELSVALQRRWDGATHRAEERSGLRTACRLPLYPSPTTCERERRRSLSLSCANRRWQRTCRLPHLIIQSLNKRIIIFI